MTRTTTTTGPSDVPTGGTQAVPNATWYGLVSCLDITGMTLLTASRSVPTQLRTAWLRQVSVTQYAVLAWVVGWAVTVAVVLAHAGAGLTLYAPVGMLMAPVVVVIVGVWTPILRAALARLRASKNEHRGA